MAFTITYLLFFAFLLLVLAYWSFSALLPKSPPTSLSCLFARTIIGAVLVIAALYVIIVVASISI
ncbi:MULTISPECIES: hypothetical protein [Providencia]|uniref:hypothetical protein n=1 Tax=Providencia TaxID=586 RepID=UPI00141A4A2A|nr:MULTISPECIES: hypothetical protein [Providencia]NIH04517.1 hypothetical protein [Providencia rettgeri]